MRRVGEDAFMALFPRGGGGGAHNTAAVAAVSAAGMSHLYPPRIAWDAAQLRTYFRNISNESGGLSKIAFELIGTFLL